MRNVTRVIRTLGLVIAVIGALPAARAGAQAALLEPTQRRLVLAGQLGYFGDSQDASSLRVVSGQLSGLYAFDAHWALAADFGAVFLSSSPERGAGDTTLRPGNPVVLGLLRGGFDRFDFTLGVGGAAPLAVIEREGAGRLQHLAYNRVQGMSGLWDVWAWAPSRGAALVFGRLGMPLHTHIRLELEAEPALMIPAREAFVNGEPVELFVPVAFSPSAQFGPLRFGLRTQAVFMTSGTDALQLSLVPWLQVRVFEAFIGARYTACIGEPLVGKRGPGSYGLFLYGGGTV